MNRKFIPFLLLLVLVAVPVHSENITTIADIERSDDSKPSVIVNESDKSIKLVTGGEPLGVVLGRLQAMSNIRFELGVSLEGQSVDFSGEASDWRGILNKLLSDYSRLEITDGKGKLVRVLIARGNKRSDLPPLKGRFIPGKVTAENVGKRQKTTELAIETGKPKKPLLENRE